MPQYRFQFRSSYMGETHWDVFQPGAPRRTVALRSAFGDHERSITAPDYRATCESAIGILRDHIDATPADMVEAFNAWRAAEYAGAVEYMSRRYPDDWQTYMPEPATPAVAGHYDAAANLWVRDDAPQAIAA